jgi:hypothetical protein
VLDDRALPTRPGHTRNGPGEEGLGKRRRPADDDVSAYNFLFAFI